MSCYSCRGVEGKRKKVVVVTKKAQKKRKRITFVAGIAAPVIAGLVIGSGFVIILSMALLNNNGLHPAPLDIVLRVDGKEYVMGIGSYGGTRPDGTGYGVDVNTIMTLPEGTIDVSRDSKLQFLSDGLGKPILQNAWVYDQSSGNQFFLDKLNDTAFQLPDDAVQGNYYVLSVSARWNEGDLVSGALYSHKIGIS